MVILFTTVIAAITGSPKSFATLFRQIAAIPIMLCLNSDGVPKRSTAPTICIPFIMASFTMNNQLRFQGRAYLGMVGMAGGSVLNVALDPLFIYVMDMGVTGAALATIISQIASFIALMVISGRIPFRSCLPAPLLKPHTG